MRTLLLFIFLLTLPELASPCDICGCSSGNYFIGPFPQFNSHFIGARYSFRKYETVLNTDKSQFSNDLYQTVEMWGGLNFKGKWSVYLFMPYNFNYSKTDDGINQNSGLGDMTIIGNYNLLNIKKLSKNEKTVAHRLWLGGGLKVPTGRFEIDTSELVSSANNQPGSGSFDFLMNINYLYQQNDWGISTYADYKINQYANEFKFGNRFYASVYAYRSLHSGIFLFRPNTGLLYEALAPNHNSGNKVEDTGGHALMSAFGLETQFKKIGIAFNLQLPLAQNLSDRQTKAKSRGMIQINFLF